MKYSINDYQGMYKTCKHYYYDFVEITAFCSHFVWLQYSDANFDVARVWKSTFYSRKSGKKKCVLSYEHTGL